MFLKCFQRQAHKEEIVQGTTTGQSSQGHICLSTDHSTRCTQIVLAVRETASVKSEQSKLPILLGHRPSLCNCEHSVYRSRMSLSLTRGSLPQAVGCGNKTISESPESACDTSRLWFVSTRYSVPGTLSSMSGLIISVHRNNMKYSPKVSKTKVTTPWSRRRFRSSFVRENHARQMVITSYRLLSLPHCLAVLPVSFAYRDV